MPSLETLAQVGLNHYLTLSALLFSLGMIAVLRRRNVIVVLMGIELMLNAVNLSFISFSYYLDNLNGQIMVFFVMTIAAAEAAIGLALVVTLYKKFNEVDLKFYQELKG